MGKEAISPAAIRPRATNIEFKPGVPAERVFPNGTIIQVITRAFDRPGVGPTERHEAAHVVGAGGEIYSATIIPSGDALGSTRPKVMTRASAAAGAAIGDYRGARWDLFLVEYFLGGNKQGAIAEASAALSGMEEELYQVARMLKIHLTIGPEEVKRAYQIADNIKNGVYSAEIRVQLPTGEIRSMQIQSNNHLVEVHKNLFEFQNEFASARRGAQASDMHKPAPRSIVFVDKEPAALPGETTTTRRSAYRIISEQRPEQTTNNDIEQKDQADLVLVREEIEEIKKEQLN